MLPAALTPEEVYPLKLRAYEQLETGSHWPSKEEWFKPRREINIDIKPFFKKPPALTGRQRLLYGLDRYPHLEKPIRDPVELEEGGVCNDEAAVNAIVNRNVDLICSKGRVRRWGRAKAMAETHTCPAGLNSDGFWDMPSDETTNGGATHIKISDADLASNRKSENERQVCSDEAELCHGPKISDPDLSSSGKSKDEKEARKLQKALKEIGNLELQQQIVGNSVGKLRKNQLEKISKKPEYLQRLQQLSILPTTKDGL
jgi:hypothetical protein